MNVAKITSEKALSLQGEIYQGNNVFNPVQDGKGDWIISLVEAQYIPLSDFDVVEYVAPEVEEEVE